MTLNGVMALILRNFTEFGNFRGALLKVVEDVVKSICSLSHLLLSFLSLFLKRPPKFSHNNQGFNPGSISLNSWLQCYCIV